MTEGERESLEGDIGGLVCMVTTEKIAETVCGGQGMRAEAEDRVLQKRGQEPGGDSTWKWLVSGRDSRERAHNDPLLLEYLSKMQNAEYTVVDRL